MKCWNCDATRVWMRVLEDGLAVCLPCAKAAR